MTAVLPREWTDGPAVPVPPGTVADLVLARATATPGAVAVRQGGTTLTYAELTERAAALAAALRERGAGPDRRVAIALRRTPDAVVAILGVLLSGAAYVPMDPDGPAARRAEILADADPVAVLTEVPADAAEPRPCPARPADAAYVLYTSGSTGRPKGVVVPHSAVLSYAVAFGPYAGVGPDTRALAFAAFGFDVSVRELLVPLAAGAEVDLVPDGDRADPARLQRFAAGHRVSWGVLPVSLLPLLDPVALPDWRMLVTGAEAPGPEQVARWTAGGRRFLNCYGPTEATVCVTAFPAEGEWTTPVPMGFPLPNQRAYVVDAALALVPPGEEGELLVGGTGLARGYLGRPGATARAFLPDPFSGEPGARLYRTGDRVVRLPDGALLFLGRLDRQVKVRGQRIEIGEVEAAVRTCPAVGQAAVEAVGGPAGTELVAYVTGSTVDAVRAWCRERLPAAAVPARVVVLDRLPLLASGKVDSAALRARAYRAPAAGPAPAGPWQTAVAAVWADLLGAAPGADDDFFAAGGHSIVAMRLVAGLRERVRRAVAVEDVFAARTVAGIAERVAAAPPLDGGELPSGSPPALSAAQRRLWFADKLAPESAAYNIALAERLHGPLDAGPLERALAAVARRHEVLRWRVPDADGVPWVLVDEPADRVALSTEDVAEADLAGRLAAEAAGRFDLATGPLWRARLLRLGPDDAVLALTFHHAVFDGWSQRPFLADLSRAYEAARAGRDPALPAPATRYADFVAWRSARDAGRGDADLAWWSGHLAGVDPVLDLPRDRPRPPVQTYRGERAAVDLAAATAESVRALATRLGATAPAVLMAGFAELVGRVTGRDDLVLGTPAADRRHAAFHPLVGFFVDVVPLRVRLDPGASFADRARAASDELLAALAHPGAPLERVVDALGLPRDPARSALVQVLFNVYNFPEPRLGLAGTRTSRVQPGLPGSAFDLTLYVVERDGTYAVEATYNPDLYDAGRIRRLLAGYTVLLDQLVAAPDAPVRDAVLSGWTELAATARDVAAPAAAPTGGAEPATDTERLVAGVWREALGRPVGATNPFFDVGGTSMAAVVVQSRLAALTGRPVRVVDVFRYPSVRAMAAYLDASATRTAELDRAAERAAARRGRSRARAAGRPGGTREGTGE
ncbi:MAG TPA: condensation domain-containing protein [Mycobacteriales bacterium]